MFVLWILLIVVVYYIFNDHAHIDLRSKSGLSAEEILKRRYVNGDIDEETYLRMKKQIGQQGGLL